MKAWEIIEAIDDPSGLIHPEKHQAIAGRTHPLGANPAFPEHQAQAGGGGAANYEEHLASRQWQKILQKAHQYLGVPLSRQALPIIRNKLVDAMGLIAQVEEARREELEALAVETVFELPEFKGARRAYEASRLVIDASLEDEVSMEGTMTSPEAEAEEPGAPEPGEPMAPPEERPHREQRTPAEQAWMEKMVLRRHFTNAMIQGAAVSNDYLFELAGRALDRIHPELRKAYGILMVSTELGYWMFPQSAVLAGARGDLQVGMTRIDQVPAEEAEEEPGQPPAQQQPPRMIPRVIARAKLFPVLIQEIIKGLTELASTRSLPRDPQDREEVIRKTDLVDLETWQMILGPKLWDDFVEAVDAESERDLTMRLYSRIQRMDVDQFNEFMRELYLRTPKAMRMLRQFAQEIRGREEPQQEAVAEIVRALID